MKRLIPALLGVVWLGLASTPTAFAEDKPAAVTYTPTSTVVAILPVIKKADVTDDNAKGDKKDAAKDAPLQERHIVKAREELTTLFTGHGFRVADDAAVQKALADGKIDLSDEENQRRAVFYQIGKAAHADLVVFVVIESVSRHNKSNSFLGQQKEGKALLKLWLVDADREQPILNAVQHEGKAASNAFMDNQIGPDTNGYSRYTIRAVGHGLDDILKDFFKPYPETVKPGGK
jgi:hypothetical protein